MTGSLPDLEDFLSAMAPLMGPMPLQEIISGNAELIDTLKEYDPIQTAATFGGLLTVPDLQSNCYRLEVLVHLALICCRGKRKPNDRIIARAFSDIGTGVAGMQEDPAEDVFVSSIATPRGNFRLIEGCWEAAGFHVQRLVNALEPLPDAPRYNRIRASVYALLQLSDLVCERAKLQRNQLGEAVPLQSLPPSLQHIGSRVRRFTRFTEAELRAHGIALDDLASFGFIPEARQEMVGDTLGHSRLERCPLTYKNGEVHLVLPTAVSVAIRRYVLEETQPPKLREVMAHLLAEEYASLFSDTPLLGEKSGAPISFTRTSNGLLAEVITPFDEGLYLNLIFFVDTLEGFADTGMIGHYPEGDDLAADVDRRIDRAHEWASSRPDFRGGLTIVVGCGLGRGLASVTTDRPRDRWRVEMVSAGDLISLSWLPRFKPLSLWRILDARDRLEELGVSVQNINGLLNLVGWVRSLDGHLVPHSEMPESFGTGDVPAFIMIEQSALRSARHEAMIAWDPHAVQFVDGSWHRVRKDGQSLFDEDDARPFFMVEDWTRSRWPACLYETSRRAWWCLLETREDTLGFWAAERIKMLKTWLSRAAPLLDARLQNLLAGPVLLKARFEGRLGDRTGFDPSTRMTLEMARAAITVEADASNAAVTLVVAPGFEDAIFHPENIAEHALAESIVEGFMRMANASLSDAERTTLMQVLVPDVHARQSHAFMAQHFRDWVRDSVWTAPIPITVEDSAFIKLGLGWRVRDRQLGGDLTGKDDCTGFLNALVRDLEDQVCADLRGFNRREVIMLALMNHESAAIDRDQWRRTSAAVLSLHDDKQATLQTMAMHEFQNSAVFQASRLLVEFAICESPVEGGLKLGRLDLGRLMAKVIMILGLGGWSDAIRWNAMEPKLRVTPLGDIHGNLSFYQQIIEPYGRAGSDLRVMDEVEKYADHFAEPEPISTEANTVEAEFWEAWNEQIGASVDDLRKFMDAIENLGANAKQAILVMKRSELFDVKLSGAPLNATATDALVEALTFKGRPNWRDVPTGFDQRDIFPWRFRRRLTILRRPLIQINNEEDPTILVSPGIVRDAVTYMVRNYYRGDFHGWQLSPKMRKWAGKSRDRIGHEFAVSVAEKLRELGWETDLEVKVTQLLGKGFERDYGDVDVLAWQRATGRVLIIECKDLQFRKTDGEIAEQLADFQGEVRPDGKPDDLRKHLDRIDLIATHLPLLSKYIKVNDVQRIESHLVFKNPVPMQFALDRMKERVTLHVFSGLEKI